MQSVSNQVSPGLGLPMIVPYFAITFSFAIISIVQVSTLVNMVIKLFTGEKEARKDECTERIPAGRWETPEDMKGPVLFLSSAASDYLNGAVIPVDGGYLVK